MAARSINGRSATGRTRPTTRLAPGQLVALGVAGEALGVSVKTLRRRIADGTVRGYRVGRLVRVNLDEVRKAWSS